MVPVGVHVVRLSALGAGSGWSENMALGAVGAPPAGWRMQYTRLGSPWARTLPVHVTAGSCEGADAQGVRISSAHAPPRSRVDLHRQTRGLCVYRAPTAGKAAVVQHPSQAGVGGPRGEAASTKRITRPCSTERIPGMGASLPRSTTEGTGHQLRGPCAHLPFLQSLGDRWALRAGEGPRRPLLSDTDTCVLTRRQGSGPVWPRGLGRRGRQVVGSLWGWCEVA